MDYIKISRSVIYKDRTDLKDFGVHVPGTINNELFIHLKQHALMGVSGAKEVALRCYNNAYYVCTLILLEADDFPELRISDYVDKILEIEKGKRHIDEVCLASMSMACLLLATYDSQRYGRDSEIWDAIYHRCTHQQWYHSPATAIFHHMLMWEYRITTPLSHIEFDPRDVIDVIENCSERDLQVYVEYICERLAFLKDQRQQMRGADMAIARIRDHQREFCENSGYNPKKDRFNYEDNRGYISDPTWEKEIRDYYQQGNEAINCYTKYYPTKEDENDSKENAVESPQTPETEVLQIKIRELESKITHQVGELQQQLTEKTQALQEAIRIIEEFRQPVKELTAKQKIRMEFAVQLFLKSGLTEEKLNSSKTKVASLLSLLLDIRSNNDRNRPEQICSNFLTYRKYYPQTQDKNTILELDRLCAELGIIAYLSTEPQGNKKV